MKAYVITVMSLPQSVEAAQRCIDSAAAFGLAVEMHRAVTPAHGPLHCMRELGWKYDAFMGNRYSRLAPCVACFLSHANLWQQCVEAKEPFVILEHDAVMVRALPNLAGECGVVNLGAPSFGKFKQPRCGIGPLVSKAFLPGAHAYYVHPQAAAQLLAKAETQACPTDVFLHTKRFAFLREAYPWVFECHETFSSIQRELGCSAKHRKVAII